jgi:hypothetical protein
MTAPAPDLVAAGRALADGGGYRAVRRARLRLPSRDVEFATRNALEDALRTADFGDAGRLIVVRALRLRGLPQGVSGPQLARALERAWQALAPHALAFDAWGAEHAPAVYFRSIHSARLAWLQRLAQGEAPREWYWSRALPEAAGAVDSTEALIAVLAELQAGAPRELAAQMRSLDAGAMGRLLNMLPAAPVARLVGSAWTAPAVGPRMRTPTAGPPAEAAALQAPPSSARAVEANASTMPPRAAVPRAAPVPPALVAMLSSFAPSDWRLHWWVLLDAFARDGRWPGAMQVHRAIDAAQSPAARPPRLAPGPPPSGTAAAPRGEIARATASPQPVAAATEQAPAGSPAPRRALADALPQPRLREPRPRWAATRPWLCDGEPTGFGGLLMLLNALEVLGFAAWLAAQSTLVQRGFPAELLARVARRLRVPADDPHAPLYARSKRERAALAAAPCNWRAFRWPRGFAADDLSPRAPTNGAQALALWQRALVRALRRHARIGLARLVTRAAVLSITPTHVDIVLPLAQADIAVRRAGLDRDLGWLPWFGRIVAFHYVAEQEARHAPG